MSKYEKELGLTKLKYKLNLEEVPKHKKKKMKKVSNKSDHKHDYIETLDEEENTFKNVCTICGKEKWTRFNFIVWGRSE